ncbi:uncharacterized protein EAE97_010912 [Botrytis byssoidea]|uniref:Uncharacterized protein n=1 Tax=Botrytis byssoidea TaxID=139641 RepID=A0A9P5LIY9_9HELO|nr:uncharacterized protein EAE97_010912 [Botrytis byssoidea]KAF7923474.1 hypothetical protein EAE97_010912 [Botrytis byssoidea]
MSDYNFDHSGFTQEHIRHLQENPLEACQRENESLRIRLETFNRMLLEAKEESETRLNRIKQVRDERDKAFDEGEKYATREIDGQLEVLRREKLEAERKTKELEEQVTKTREMAIQMKTELEKLKERKDKEEETGDFSLEQQRNMIAEELQEAREVIRGKELHIQHLKEEARGSSARVSETPPVASAQTLALIEQIHVLMAQRDDMRQQLEILTENFMGTPPKEVTPKGDESLRETPEQNTELSPGRFKASPGLGSANFKGSKRILHAPSPLRQQSSTTESVEHEDSEKEVEVKEDDSEQEEEELDTEKEEKNLKESIERDENDTSLESYRKDKDLHYQRLVDRIKELERRDLRLEHYHDMSHVTRAILSLTPVHFEAYRERKEAKRKEEMVLLDVMDKERKILRKQNQKLEKQLQVLAGLRSKEKGKGTGDAQDFVLTQAQHDANENATKDYKRLYEEAEKVVMKMLETSADVDAEEVSELRKEREFHKKRIKELEEEIDGPLGLREQLAFSTAENTDDFNAERELTRVRAELKWCKRERDMAIEESHVEKNLTSIMELMDQLSQKLAVNVYPTEEKYEQCKEMTKKYRQCQRELSDEKEKTKTLERFLEEKYMEYEDLAGDVHDDSMSARLARAFIELYQTKRKLMDKTIQRNSLTKSAVGCLTTVLQHNEILEQKIYTLRQHPDREPELPITDVDLKNEGTIARLHWKIDLLEKRLHKAQSDIKSAEKKSKKSKERLDKYMGLSFNKSNTHPKVESLKLNRKRSPLDPNATDPEVIAHLKVQLKDTDDLVELICQRYDVAEGEAEDEKEGLKVEKMEAAERAEKAEIATRRLEDCMDLVNGPLSQKVAWDNLKGLLRDAREKLKIRMNEWKEKDGERDWAVESLEKMLKESEEREAALAKLLHSTQEDMKSEGTKDAKIAELKEQLSKNEERIRDLLREKDEHKAEADGLESFLRASETQTTQLEEQLRRGEERIRDLQLEKDTQQSETERLEDLLKARETQTAEFFKTLRDEEEEQYRVEIERLHELLLLREDEDEQFREEIERLHELHKTSEGKVTELLEISMKTSTRLSDLEDEITRWKVVAGESIGEIEHLQKQLEDAEAKVELQRITHNQNAETQTDTPTSTNIETQTEDIELPQPVISPPAVEPKSKMSKKKPITKIPRDPRHHPQRSDSEYSEKELETSKPPRPQPKHNKSLRQEMDSSPAPSPSPAPSITIRLTSKAHAKKKVHGKESVEYDSPYKVETLVESEDDEIPDVEIAQESPIQEMQKVGEAVRSRGSRNTRNPDPVYTGQLLVRGLGKGEKERMGKNWAARGQKRKASESGIEVEKVKKGKKQHRSV